MLYKKHISSEIIRLLFRKPDRKKERVVLSEAAKKLREKYLQSYMMRNWISSKLQKLNQSQIQEIYGLVKEWTGEEMPSS